MNVIGIVPSADDWGDISRDFDAQYAYSKFGGRTNDEMLLEFKKNITARTADLNSMPERPFRYYIFGFKKFIDNVGFSDFEAPDVANCFISLVEEKLERQPSIIRPVISELIGTLEYLAKNQRDFGADEDVYGSFEEKLKKIKSMCATSSRAGRELENLPPG